MGLCWIRHLVILVKLKLRWTINGYSKTIRAFPSFSVNSPSFRCVFLVWDVLTFWDEFARKLANYLWIYHLKLQETVITCNWRVYFGTTLSLGVVISRNILCNKFMTMLDRLALLNSRRTSSKHLTSRCID